jgi:adenylate cyclase class IV
VLFSRLPDNQLLDFPIGALHDNYLEHADRAFAAADEALALARLGGHGERLIDDLRRLVKELSKSHKVLVEVADMYRRVGRDPATFAQRFQLFYLDFKIFYDAKDWVDEDTSCSEIRLLGSRVLPGVKPLLDDQTFRQLERELGTLENADLGLVQYFRQYLEEMNSVVEAISTELDSGNLLEAIQAKLDFEAQISPSFRRSKEMLGRMNGSITDIALV